MQTFNLKKYSDLGFQLTVTLLTGNCILSEIEPISVFYYAKQNTNEQRKRLYCSLQVCM